MATLHNEIIINATPAKVWEALSNLELLEQYDPAVESSEVTSENKTGTGASRKCVIKSAGWYKERVTVWKPNEALAFELIECSFPVNKLKHSYTIKPIGNKTQVTQVMEYEMKMGFLGKLMDIIMVRKKWDDGIKKFFTGLKEFTESR